MAVALVKSAPKRKLVAVIGAAENGIFVRHHTVEGSIYISEDGTSSFEEMSLEKLMTTNLDRTPVYAGDDVMIKFVV